ncbi:hypothetical protein [Serratia marcescens]|uniref:hypothetical protein n=1 Tax=Serratia marcescens TaxID=615 RepID=UPI003D086030
MEENSNAFDSFTSFFKKASGTISTVKDICKKSLEIRDQNKDIEHRNTYIELQSKIESIQSDLVELRSIYSELSISHSSLKHSYAEKEREISELSKKLNNIERYEPFEIAPGSFVMRIKPVHQGDGLPRYICPNCVKDNVTSILQTRTQGKGEWLKCHACNLSIEIKPNSSSYHFGK